MGIKRDLSVQFGEVTKMTVFLYVQIMEKGILPVLHASKNSMCAAQLFCQGDAGKSPLEIGISKV